MGHCRNQQTEKPTKITLTDLALDKYQLGHHVFLFPTNFFRRLIVKQMSPETENMYYLFLVAKKWVDDVYPQHCNIIETGKDIQLTVALYLDNINLPDAVSNFLRFTIRENNAAKKIHYKQIVDRWEQMFPFGYSGNCCNRPK